MSKKQKALIIIASILAAVLIFFLVINLIPPAKNVEENPFVGGEGSLPMVAAHRGGGECNPENTMLAFREAVKTYKVDIIESDLYLTEDGYLVYNHDAYVDETCNINGDISLAEVKELCKDKANRHYIKDMTLTELKALNFGYYFEDENGNRPYKDDADFAAKGLQIATVDQLFAEFYATNPDLLFIVEIKDEGERGYEACSVLSDTLDAYPAYRDRIVVGTFHDEIEAELKAKYPDLYRGAPTGTAAKFVLTQILKVNVFDKSDFACLQIPTSYDLGITINLDKSTYIDRAHRRNIAVQYWTINDAETMRELIELGCDCIMTDDPELLQSVLEEYRK
jgi:glycerophosphoryl diester phosphodiesterase